MYMIGLCEPMGKVSELDWTGLDWTGLDWTGLLDPWTIGLFFGLFFWTIFAPMFWTFFTQGVVRD